MTPQSVRSEDMVAQDLGLFPFQAEDVKRLVDRKSVLIGNEMGTGKTYEAIALDLLHRQEYKQQRFDDAIDPKTLVVAPLTTHYSWLEHFTELTDLRVRVVDTKNRRQLWLKDQGEGADVFVVHWEVLRLMPELKKQWWLHVIADEAHKAKNRKAQQTRSLKLLRATFKTAMTGSPVINRPDELWSILNWLYPSKFGGYWNFFRRYVDYEIGYPHGYHIVKGPKNEEELRHAIKPFFARRLKKDVLPDLPDKYYTNVWVDLHPKQRKAYDQMRKEMIAWLDQQDQTKPLVAPVVIAQLIRLQQLALAYADVSYDTEEGLGSVTLTEPSTKLDALMEIVNDTDQPLVVYSQFKGPIRLATERLKTAGVEYRTITGDDSNSDRAGAIRDFQEGKARIILGTIAAGGVGITLHRASTVIFLDRTWSPALNSQAEDRLHRIGQKNAVQVIDIMARNTVDLGRRQKLERKKEWIRRLLD